MSVGDRSGPVSAETTETVDLQSSNYLQRASLQYRLGVHVFPHGTMQIKSLPLSHPAEFHPIFGNDGIVYYTRYTASES